jgi:hypothetical protein
MRLVMGAFVVTTRSNGAGAAVLVDAQSITTSPSVSARPSDRMRGGIPALALQVSVWAQSGVAASMMRQARYLGIERAQWTAYARSFPVQIYET